MIATVLVLGLIVLCAVSVAFSALVLIGSVIGWATDEVCALRERGAWKRQLGEILGLDEVEPVRSVSDR